MRSGRPIRVGALLLASAVVGSAALFAAETFTFDRNHTLVGFRIRHILSKVEGRFREYDGTIWLDRQSPATSKVDLTIQAASIDTGTPDRDKHLRSPDFFEVEKYPTITFRSTKVESTGNDSYLVIGDLTMHGVTKSVQVPVKSNGFAKVGKGEKAGFEATLTLNRKDYGINWNRAIDQGGMLLGDDVEILIQVEADKKEAEPAKTGGGR